jgi:hypothetical protein
LAFAAVTAIVLAGTVYLANQAAAVTADEHALARARTCAAGASENRDCVIESSGVVVGSLQREDKSEVTKLTVSSGSKEVTLTFPRGVGSAFQQIQDTEFVGLTIWRGDIVTVTAQGDTEITSTAPAELYRSRLTAAFYAASFTVVLAGVTFISAVLSEWIFANSRGRLGYLIASVVIFGGFATAVSATVIAQGGSLRAALLTAPIIVVVGIAVAGGIFYGVFFGAVARRTVSSGR